MSATLKTIVFMMAPAILLVAVSGALGQSSDPSLPTPINSNEITGKIKALVALRDNPLFSAPGRAQTVAALEKLELLVVIDELLTDTAKVANVAA